MSNVYGFDKDVRLNFFSKFFVKDACTSKLSLLSRWVQKLSTSYFVQITSYI